MSSQNSRDPIAQAHPSDFLTSLYTPRGKERPQVSASLAHPPWCALKARLMATQSSEVVYSSSGVSTEGWEALQRKETLNIQIPLRPKERTERSSICGSWLCPPVFTSVLGVPKFSPWLLPHPASHCQLLFLTALAWAVKWPSFTPPSEANTS